MNKILENTDNILYFPFTFLGYKDSPLEYIWRQLPHQYTQRLQIDKGFYVIAVICAPDLATF